MTGTMTGRSDDKARLAQELLELLKSDISSRAKDRPGGSGSAGPAGGGGPKLVEAPGNTMAGGHQKRDNKRFTYPVLRVNIGTAGFNSLDWSLGGVQVRDYVGTLKQHARVKIAISEGKADSTYYSVDCRVARIDPKQRVMSLQFQNMSRGLFDWLSALQLMQTKKRA